MCAKTGSEGVPWVEFKTAVSSTPFLVVLLFPFFLFYLGYVGAFVCPLGAIISAARGN